MPCIGDLSNGGASFQTFSYQRTPKALQLCPDLANQSRRSATASSPAAPSDAVTRT
jgi:hypothetical protein